MCTQMPIYFLPKWQNFYSIKSRKGSHFEKEGILTFFCETLNYEYKVYIMAIAQCYPLMYVNNLFVISAVELEHYIYHLYM